MPGLFRHPPQPQQRIRRVPPAAGAENHNGTFALTGGGVVTSVRQKGGQVTWTFTGGGVLTSARQKAGQATWVLTGGGVLTSIRQKGGLVTWTLTGGGIWTVAYSVSSGVPNVDATFTLTGGGVIVSLGQKAGFRTQTLTGGGVAVLGLLAGRQGLFLLTGGGRLVTVYRGAHQADPDLTGGGILQWLVTSGRFASVNLTGGGQLIFQGENLALTNLGAVMDAIAQAIVDSGATERAYPWPAESISPPCAVVAYPTDIEFDVTYNRGADRCVIPVYFITGRVVERSARDTLAGIITGATGIKEALDGDLDGTVQTLRVMDMRIMNVQVSGIDYLAAQFNAEVYQ